jgi:hypothetical protein
MDITIDAGEAQALLSAIGRLPPEIRRRVSVAVRQNAQALAADARGLLRAGANAGYSERVDGVASPPGGPPATQTGLLRRSIRVTRARRDGLSYRITTPFYARYLEVGAERGARGGTLLPRPFLTIARQRQAGPAAERIAAAIRGVLGDVA